MIINNQFFIKDLKFVILMGQSSVFDELIKINSLLNLSTTIITSSHQSKLIDKKLNFNIFNNLDKKFEDFIKKKVKIQNTIFISLGARYIFKKEIIEKFFLNNLVNFHSTRLPLDAGGGGFSWKIMREDRIDNQLVHLIDEGIDTGPIIANNMSLFPKQCQIPKDFENYGIKKFIKFYSEFLNKINNGEFFNLKPQINYLGRYNPRLNSEIDAHSLMKYEEKPGI